jgi:hypothetical protein
MINYGYSINIIIFWAAQTEFKMRYHAYLLE